MSLLGLMSNKHAMSDGKKRTKIVQTSAGDQWEQLQVLLEYFYGLDFVLFGSFV